MKSNFQEDLSSSLTIFFLIEKKTAPDFSISAQFQKNSACVLFFLAGLKNEGAFTRFFYLNPFFTAGIY